jgi:amidase
MTDELSALDAVAQAELVDRGEITPVELVEAAITRIEKLDGELNAVIHRRFERARDDVASATLPQGPFRGVPMVLKDLDGFSAGDPCHEGNALLKAVDWHGEHDSFLVAKLRSAGFVFVGKTNAPEFGLTPTTEPIAYGPTRNPWDPTRSPGGSSGGSGAAVASGMVAVGHAGDGGGSIRIPSSACGLFGLKPTRGRVSFGPDDGESWAGLVVRHAITRSVRDSAAVLDVIAGPMPGDP